MYVAEPLAEGEFFELTRMVDDETEVRAAAQAALAEASDAGLDGDRPPSNTTRRLTVAGRRRAARTNRRAPIRQRAARFDELAAELAEGLERLGAPGERPGERRFLHPMRADVLRPALS